MEWEFRFMKYIGQKLNNKHMDKIMKTASLLSNMGIIFAVIILIMFFYATTRYLSIKVGYSMLSSAVVVNGVLKPLFSRQRPFLIDESIIPLVKKRPKDMSFPSGHTSAAFTFATSLFINNHLLGLIALIYAILVGISRIYLQVHYPTDVICGGLIGVVVPLIVNIFL